jgi:hypothetical protein
MSWDYWIKEKIVDVDYDRLIELAVSSYNLGKKTRKMGQKDRVQFIVLWWRDNKEKFFRYNTTTKVGALLNIDHATVVYHYKSRKKSRIYEEETRCIKDFIES